MNNNPADILFNAYKNKRPVTKDSIHSEIEKSEAYAIQHQLTNKKAAELDEHITGYKISLTSEETQQLFHSTTPLYGALTGESISDGHIKLEEMLSPLLEMELMFTAKEVLSPEDDTDSILAKTTIAPGLEVPDSRFTDWFPKVSLGQVIADSAVAGKIVVGEQVEGLTFEQLENIHARLLLDGEKIADGPSTEVLGNPLNAVKWLIDELAITGRKIERGMTISSGTFILPKVLKRGEYVAEFDKLGNVRLIVS